MKVEEAARRRRSVRSYQEKEIPEGKFERVMDTVRMAPSANNKQDWRFVVVRDEDRKEMICEAARNQRFIKEAPIVVAGVATEPEYVMSCDIPGGIVDVAIALDHLSLKAAEEGLGTCWIGAFDQERVKGILNIPEDCEVVSLMTVGYPVRSLEEEDKDRKELEEIVSYDTFRGS